MRRKKREFRLDGWRLAGVLITVGLGLAVLFGLAELALGGTGKCSISLGADYETFKPSFFYDPDPNGGFGLTALLGRVLPEGGDSEIALGPCLRCNIGDLAAAAADRVIPGPWPSLANAPARLYGTIGCLWEVTGGGFIFDPGTQLLLFPEWKHIHPSVWTEYLKPYGNADVAEEFKILVGAEYTF